MYKVIYRNENEQRSLGQRTNIDALTIQANYVLVRIRACLPVSPTCARENSKWRTVARVGATKGNEFAGREPLSLCVTLTLAHSPLWSEASVHSPPGPERALAVKLILSRVRINFESLTAPDWSRYIPHILWLGKSEKDAWTHHLATGLYAYFLSKWKFWSQCWTTGFNQHPKPILNYPVHCIVRHNRTFFRKFL